MKNYIVIQKEKNSKFEEVNILICNENDAKYYKRKGYKVIEIKNDKKYSIAITSQWLSISEDIFDSFE